MLRQTRVFRKEDLWKKNIHTYNTLHLYKEVFTCGEYTAEGQEGELARWLKRKLHTGARLSVESKRQSHMLVFYTVVPPPSFLHSGLSTPGISPTALSIFTVKALRLRCRDILSVDDSGKYLTTRGIFILCIKCITSLGTLFPQRSVETLPQRWLMAYFFNH